MMTEQHRDIDEEAVWRALSDVAVDLPGWEDDGIAIDWSIIRLARDTAATGVIGQYLKEPPR